LIRAEALFRRFQRTVEAIDKKSNFPAPNIRKRPTAAKQTSSSGGAAQNLPSASSSGVQANTSGIDTVTAGGTNSGASTSNSGSGSGLEPDSTDAGKVGKGKKPSSPPPGPSTKSAPPTSIIPGKNDSEELQDQRPKIISSELRGLLSRKVEVLPRKVVKGAGEGRSTLGKQ